MMELVFFDTDVDDFGNAICWTLVPMKYSGRKIENIEFLLFTPCITVHERGLTQLQEDVDGSAQRQMERWVTTSHRGTT